MVLRDETSLYRPEFANGLESSIKVGSRFINTARRPAVNAVYNVVGAGRKLSDRY